MKHDAEHMRLKRFLCAVDRGLQEDCGFAVISTPEKDAEQWGVSITMNINSGYKNEFVFLDIGSISGRVYTDDCKICYKDTLE